MPSPTPRPHGFAVGRKEHGSQTRHSTGSFQGTRGRRGCGCGESSGPHPWIERLRRNHDGAFGRTCLKENRAIRIPTRLYGALSRCGRLGVGKGVGHDLPP